ncbi:TPA: helix-turn-helix domain-containing protein [Streptococcus suis]|uniref:helix-turn-helix transcriptional regulator n=1 Tax=Streptococcus suis TaxID=1307 RepID=UPI001C97EC60|nr:helix-turn-helix transcriptional regulator [Streptococcus suis]MBY4991161.1 XRE family transcriptional regulator [Streptococcus suis]HEM2780333.1 XRE family transcriptional regulator [Streptococcus suis]HEM3580409.1 XRE family transcriptional regulator [Streptococcus suis]
MNRLKELRKEKGLSQVAFSKEIGIPLRTLQSWENGESQIKPDKAQALADHFGVPVGYLLGYDVGIHKPIDPNSIEHVDIEMDRLQANISAQELADFLDVPISQLLKWEKLEQPVDYKHAKMLANFFQTTPLAYTSKKIYQNGLNSFVSNVLDQNKTEFNRLELKGKIDRLNDDDYNLISSLVDRMINSY